MGKLRAGASLSNITPPLGCSLAGGMTDRIATDIHDELYVRSLVLDDGNTRLAIALCDLCVLPRGPIEEARNLIAQHASIPPSHVLIAATHTHSAPPAAHLFQSVPDPKYVEWLAVRIADGVRRAANRLAPARIGWGVGREERLLFNRRFMMKPGAIPPDPFGNTSDQVLTNPGIGNPNVVRAAGPIDPDVSVLAVETIDGRPLAVLTSYALHYVGGTGAGHVSADYFAAWANAMERRAGAGFVPILANACSGDINNVDVFGSRTPAAPYARMNDVAGMLATECERVWRSVRWQDTVELAGAEEAIELGVRKPSPADLAAAKKTLGADPGPYKERPQIYARETTLLAGYPDRVAAHVQALRIGTPGAGQLGLATLPGEAFVEIGMHIKKRSPFGPTFLIELANDYLGYIPTPAAMDQGGYETWRAKSSFLEREAAPKLAAAALRQLEKVA